MLTISNETLSVTLNPQGAEILSIYHKETKLDYLWNGDAAYWPKTSPVLFPVVGGLKDNRYQYKGKQYEMGRHGFARESVYTVTAQTTSSLTFTLMANEATLLMYPFDFKFSVKHELIGNTIHVSYLVENTGQENLLFSVGAHPAFHVPLIAGTHFSDYSLLFSSTETVGRYPIAANGLIENNATPLLNNTQELKLAHDLFYNDAIVFKNLQSNSISIVSDKTPHGLKLEFNDFPYMGIWQPKDAPFVCIEPWCGLGDVIDTTSELQDKEGIEVLPAAGLFERTWSVSLF